MGQGILSFDENVRALMSGLLVGDLVFVNGDSGDDNANGLDWGHALKGLDAAAKKTANGRHDYILAAGAMTLTAAIAFATTRLHLIGVGMQDPGSTYRGLQITTPALNPALTVAASSGALGMEIANIRIASSVATTSQMLIDDLGSAGVYVHDCTFVNGSDATAITADIESTDWTFKRCEFLLCAKALDFAQARARVEECLIQSAHTSAIGIHLSNANAKYAMILKNMFNLSGGTTDHGLLAVTNATLGTVVGNLFNTAVSDPIEVTTTTGWLNVNNFSSLLEDAGTYFFAGVQ
jgi:hypothetical protein